MIFEDAFGVAKKWKNRFNFLSELFAVEHPHNGAETIRQHAASELPLSGSKFPVFAPEGKNAKCENGP